MAELAQSLAARLRSRINHAAALSVPGSVALKWPDGGIAFVADSPEVRWLADDQPTQAEFWFSSAAAAETLLLTSEHPLQTFLEQFAAGELRANGYLLWSFPLLSLFR